MKLKRRLHVAMRTDVEAPGGLNTVVRSIAAAQSREGLHVTVASGRHIGEGLDPRDFDFVHYHFAPTARRFLQAPGWRDVDRVFHFHGPWAAEGRVHGDNILRVAGKFLVERRTYRRFERFIVASEAFAEVLGAAYGIKRHRIAVVDLGVDAEVYQPGNAMIARTELGLPSGSLVAAVRRLEPRMGLDVLIRAMGCLEDVHLAIAGGGDAERSLRTLALSLGLGDRVHFLGRVSEADKILLYRAADLTVVPTRALEGFGLVVLESMACGTPVVTSRQGGLLQAMGPFAPDWSFEVGDHEELARLIVRAVKAPVAADVLRAYARTRTWDVTATRIDEAIGA